MITQKEQTAVEHAAKEFFAKVGIEGDVRVAYTEEEGLRIAGPWSEPQ